MESGRLSAQCCRNRKSARVVKRAIVMLGLPFAAIALAVAAPAKVVTYTLPEGLEDFALPEGEGADVTVANCAACHSLDYIRTQPRGKGAQFWKDEVHKMVAVYGAPIEPADAEIISTYLAKTYGEPAK